MGAAIGENPRSWERRRIGRKKIVPDGVEDCADVHQNFECVIGTKWGGVVGLPDFDRVRN